MLDRPSRLAAVSASGLLNLAGLDQAGRQERLSKLTRSAVMILRADASQVNVLDADWQRVIAQYPEPADGPLPVGQSGCSVVVRTDRTQPVTDTQGHPVMCDMPWTARYRGYLGSPVRWGGHPVGAICVLTLQPREWDDSDILSIEAFARLVELAVAKEDPE